MAQLTSLAASCAVAHSRRPLEFAYIQRTLDLYNDEHRYLTAATWEQPVLEGELALRHYPFTVAEHIDYVTASMVMVYVSQLGFVYTRVLCDEQILPFNTNQFFFLRDEGRIVFSRFHDLHFADKIFVSEGSSTMVMSVERFACSKNRFIGEIHFDIGNTRCTGRARVAVI